MRTFGCLTRSTTDYALCTFALLLASLTACESDTIVAPPQAASAGPTSAAGSGGMAPAGVKIDRSALADVGTDKPLDYADPRMWLCRPGNDPDECDAKLDSTELLPDGTRKIVPHVKAAQPAFDCFYAYPTVKLTSAGPMTDFMNIAITLDPLLGQAARFNEVCRMYAPLYRQNGVVPGAGGMPTPGGDFMLGLQDVRDAFQYYLKNLNAGRKVVLMGHSQGTGMITQMMITDVDPVPEVRAKLVSAVLLGGGVAVPIGQKVGGTFKNIPLCDTPGQTGCVMSYVSYSSEVPPTEMSLFGRSPGEGQTVGCTEPAALAGHAGARYSGSYFRLERINPGLSPDGFDALPKDVTTGYILYRDVFRGTCKDTGTHSYLEISLELPAGDMRPPPPYHSRAIEGALGLHLVDYALELDDLIGAVRLQGAAAVAKP
jgi:hypothetical protein